MKRIVFLDYDGVINRRMWANEKGKWSCRYGYPEDGTVNDIQAVQWVSEFCEKYGYDIVVTSTWRKYPEWESCLRNAGLRENINILGATDLPCRDRAEEIADYLSMHSGVEDYLIFDDEESLLKSAHVENLVLCDTDYGFGEREYKLAVATHLSRKYKSSNSDADKAFTDDGDATDVALSILYAIGEVSTALLQRTLRIGFGRASKIIETLLEAEVVFQVKKNECIKYKPLVEYNEAKRLLK